MDNETDIIKKYVKNLSKDMRDYLAKDTWPQKLSLIAQTNKMSEEQASALKTEVFLTLIGIENHSDLKINIQENVADISYDTVQKIAGDIENNIFSEIKPLLAEIEKTNNEAEKMAEENPSKDSVLNGIENPTPTKPFIQNPAGKNAILDAQHNLPVGEKKILISSAAVPSRGPLLNNIKTGFTPPPVPVPVTKPFIPPVIPPIKQEPVAPQSITPQPITPPPPTQPVQPQKPPEEPAPSAPAKYTVDPYREPLQ